MIKNKKAEHFQAALIVILLSVAVSLVAFLSAENKVTGFATANSYDVVVSDLREFNNVNELSSLSKGTYYIDANGIVYWLDDESRPAIAKIKFVRDESKNRQIYIDNDGNIGYILS